MIEQDRRRLEEVISTCADRVVGVNQIRKRKILVMLNFLRENGYKYTHKACGELANELGITKSHGTVSGYITRFDAEWEVERTFIEAAENARLNDAAERTLLDQTAAADSTLIDTHSDEVVNVKTVAGREKVQKSRGESIHRFDIGEREIRRFVELMNKVRDERDNRGRKLKLLELLVYYVFHFLLINERTDKCGYDNENHKEIMQMLGVKKIPKSFDWVSDVVKNKINKSDFRGALLKWLSEFASDTKSYSDELENLILYEGIDCEEMMRRLRKFVTFSIDSSLRSSVKTTDAA